MTIGDRPRDGADMFLTRLPATGDAVPPKDNAARSAVAHADATDAADPAIRTDDDVDDCGIASFPASDPPSWWSGR
jgi:hypothetical protein